MSPADVVTVATFPFDEVPAGGPDCDHVPEAAIESMEPTDVLLQITGPYPTIGDEDAPTVGRVIVPRGRGTSEAVHGCADNGDTLTDYLFDFRAGDHEYTALLVIGADAGHLMPTAMLVLNSFRAP